MNSEIEEISEPCHPSLLNMPIVVMEEVLKNLDCVSIFRLRKVCRDLRFSIEEINPELHFDFVTLELPLTTSSLESYFKEIAEEFRMYVKKLLHDGPRTGCSLTWNQENVGKCPQITMEDAETLLKNPKLILKSLSIDLVFEIGNLETIQKKERDLEKFYESMKSLLGNRDQLLKIKEIRLEVQHLSQAAALLKCTDPHSLKTISIDAFGHFWPNELDFSELEVLEQWKNAEELKVIGNFILTPVESFASFETITVWV